MREFFVDTPLGKLKVWAKHGVDSPEDFPGVYVDLIRDGEEDTMLACVEYESTYGRIQACVFGDLSSDEPTDIVPFEGVDEL